MNININTSNFNQLTHKQMSFIFKGHKTPFQLTCLSFWKHIWLKLDSGGEEKFKMLTKLQTLIGISQNIFHWEEHFYVVEKLHKLQTGKNRTLWVYFVLSWRVSSAAGGKYYSSSRPPQLSSRLRPASWGCYFRGTWGPCGRRPSSSSGNWYIAWQNMWWAVAFLWPKYSAARNWWPAG